MSSSFSKAVLALLAASSVSAIPTRTSSSIQMRNLPQFSDSKASPVAPLESSDAAGIVADMLDDATTVGRFKTLLLKDEDNLLDSKDLRQRTIFDFNSQTNRATNSTGGAIALANIANFPILTDLGVSVAMGFLGPCGLNTPHTHPRATEFLTLVDGDVLESGFILENGFADSDKVPFEVRSTIGKNQGTVFPVGSNHWQFNPTCKPATFVAALSSEDPGTSQIAQNFFNLNGDVIEATLGFPESIDGQNIHMFKSKIPANVAEIVEKCVATCK